MTFIPALPDPQTFGRSVPPLLDLVGRDLLLDDVDRAAVEAAQKDPDAVALWRSWHIPADGVPPTRVFVLESSGSPDAFSEMPQRVEVYRTGAVLSGTTRSARHAGALLWLARDVEPMRVAPVFDVVDDAGARFEPGHEMLAGVDLEQVAAYLEAGAPVLATTGRLTDVVEPERGAVVPMSYRTDGCWLWTESVAYYLRAYRLAPAPDLLAHVRKQGASMPAPDAADEHRALAALFQSAAIVPA
jgi:hypothetical protein